MPSSLTGSCGAANRRPSFREGLRANRMPAQRMTPLPILFPRYFAYPRSTTSSRARTLWKKKATQSSRRNIVVLVGAAVVRKGSEASQKTKDIPNKVPVFGDILANDAEWIRISGDGDDAITQGD